ALHIKYANRDFTDPEKYNTFFYDEYKFNNVKHIIIKGLAACEVISSDSIKLSVERSGINYIKFNISADTLIVFGGYPAERSADYKLNSSPQNLRLFLPANKTL